LPGVSLGPIASGLPKDLVNQLVDAQREPIRQLEARKQNEEARLKLAQDLLGKISSVNAGISEISRFKQFHAHIHKFGATNCGC
jgi:flagellar hook-associated protein 2